MILIVFLQSFSWWFIYTKAANDTQPITCNWPSEMMSNYFNFQRESIRILLWTEINSARFSASSRGGWLFTNRVLTLSKSTAIDLLASSVLWNTKVFISNSTTTLILFTLATASVLRSNTEWLNILYQDRPIVRDYKEMLDIETELFNVAYYRSKQINLVRPFEWNLLNEYNQLIKKYQKIWLLEPWTELKWSETLADIIIGLVEMNAAMKNFIMAGNILWKQTLYNYNWCFWNQTNCEKTYWWTACCNRENAIIKFSSGAITQLHDDYKNVRVFGKCNAYATYFKDNLNKTINNNKKSVETSIDEINKAMKRLKSTYSKSNRSKESFKNRCDISNYEMTQLQSYWGWGRNCRNQVFKTDISLTMLEKDRFRDEKIAKKELANRDETTTKKANKSDEVKNMIIWDIPWKLKDKPTTNERQQIRYTIYWNTEYNPEFSYDLNSNFTEIFDESINQFSQSQENAIATEISDLFPKWKWILSQIDTAIKANGELKSNLQKISDKQCSQ